MEIEVQEVQKQRIFFKGLMVSVALLIVFIVAYSGYIITNDNKRERIEVLENVALLIDGRLDGNLDYLALLADMRVRNEITPSSFESRTKDYLTAHDELINFTWVDSNGYIKGVSPIAGNQQIIGLHLDLPEPARVSALARQTKTPQYTQAFEAIQGDCSFELWYPVYQKQQFLGLFAAVYSCQKLLNSLEIGSTLSYFQISLTNSTRSFSAMTTHPDSLKAGDLDIRVLETHNGLLLGVAKYQSVFGDINLSILTVAVLLLLVISGASVIRVRKDMRRRQLLQHNLEQSNYYLHESNQRFRLLFESSPVGMILVNGGGYIVDANQYVCDLFDYDVGQLLSQELTMLVEKKSLNKFREVSKKYNGRTSLPTIDSHLIAIDGIAKSQKIIPLEVALAPIKLKGKLHTVVSVLDSSERRNFIKNLNAKNDALNASNIKLVESNSQLERFAYICSHDLQEPVRMVQSFGQLLEEQVAQQLDEKSSRYLTFMIDGANRAREMINDMLQYCRNEQPIANYQQVDLSRTLRHVEETLLSDGENSGKMIWQDDLPTLDAVPSQLFQLILNLVNNGLKFNRSTQPTVEISAIKSKQGWSIAVKDNGIGIAQEYQQQIFEIFERLHGNREFPGTGIGLASCKRIAQNHQATIRLESIVGQGSTFIIDWPNTFVAENA